MNDREPPQSQAPVAVSSFRPCPSALALGKVPARQWRTRADVARLLESLRARIESNPTAIGVFGLSFANGIALIPFLLEGVGADPALNQPDLIHPTAEGQVVIADTVWATLRSVLQP